MDPVEGAHESGQFAGIIFACSDAARDSRSHYQRLRDIGDIVKLIQE